MSEPRPVVFDREALIASLQNDERIEALHAALDEAEAQAAVHIQKVLLHSTKEVDQRKIDFARGYYAGARYWTGARMSDAQTRIAILAAQIEEDDAE